MTGPGGVAPSRPPRLVATDLDGTLLRSDGTVSARTRDVLVALDEAGVHVVFVTARPPRWLDAVADLVGGHGLVIAMNGAALYDAATRRVTECHGFDPGALAAVVRDLRAALPRAALAVESVDGPTFDPAFRHGPEHAHDDADLPPDVVAPVERALGTGVGKLLARDTGTAVGSADGQDAFFARVRDVVGDRALLAYSGAGGLAELTPPGVTKAAALARWSAAQGVDAADVWAFGDMPNDLPMLGWAGRSFAVANAHPDVLGAVTDRTASNDDDGVAVALEGLLGLLRGR